MSAPALIHDQVACYATTTPDAIAIEHDGTQWTYQQLDAASTAFAHELLDAGTQTEDLIAVHAHRRPETLVAMLGAWKARAAYLPIDPDLPQARQQQILDDARPRLLVSSTPLASIPALAPPDATPPSHPADPKPKELPTVRHDDLAYVLYTSGSTGTPKGVQVEHHGISHRAHIQSTQFQVQPTERCSQYCNLAWDASLFEILIPWQAGATLCLIPDQDRRSGTALSRFLANNNIHVAFFPPSVLATIPETPLPGLRMVMVGGDAFSESLVARWGTGRRFVNLYGPTETTIWASTDECKPGQPITLGHPLPGVHMTILDEDGNTVPPGTEGEICIHGSGLARGYLGMPEATQHAFIPHPDQAETRLYRTGDQGAVLPDGRIAMSGRIDGQVKIRGMRIELGDIESALGNLAGVRACAVTTDLDPHGNKRLLAYLHMEDTPPGPAKLARPDLTRRLRQEFLEALPAPLAPSHFLELAPLPRTANGKQDRNALPPITDLLARASAHLEQPRTPTEHLLARLWTEALGTPLGIHDNVFEHGAHSLLATRVQEQLAAELGHPIDILRIFEHPTIAGLANRITAGARPTPRAPPAPVAQPAAARGAARRAAQTQRRRPGTNPTEAP